MNIKGVTQDALAFLGWANMKANNNHNCHSVVILAKFLKHI